VHEDVLPAESPICEEMLPVDSPVQEELPPVGSLVHEEILSATSPLHEDLHTRGTAFPSARADMGGAFIISAANQQKCDM
jgi:hypothetical protein